MADEIVLPIPNLELPQHFFTLSSPSLAPLHKNAAIQLLAGIKSDRRSFHLSQQYILTHPLPSQKWPPITAS